MRLCLWYLHFYDGNFIFIIILPNILPGTLTEINFLLDQCLSSAHFTAVRGLKPAQRNVCLVVAFHKCKITLKQLNNKHLIVLRAIQ